MDNRALAYWLHDDKSLRRTTANPIPIRNRSKLPQQAVDVVEFQGRALMFAAAAP